uniref:Major Capsid Protein n=1 Tax=Dikerogammarus haemobaphes virus 1 TaxID=2704946 RepID=A0A6G9HDP1_9VIRU|nr:major Capsid Protein [Dikerogammarus haemobaphes virus 1]
MYIFNYLYIIKMTTEPPLFTDPRQMAQMLMRQLVKSETVAKVMFDLGTSTNQKPVATYHATEHFKLEPSITGYRVQNEDTELGKTATINMDPLMQDVTYLNEINISFTLPELVIDSNKNPPSGTAIGYIENFTHHLFNISILLNTEKIYNSTNSIFDLTRQMMPEHKQKAYDQCIGNTDSLLTNRCPQQTTRVRVEGQQIIFPIEFGSLLPLLVQKNELDRIRIVIESKPLIDIVQIRNLPAQAGEHVITKNDIRTINRMNQQVPLGDVKYELIYKLTTVHKDFTAPKEGVILFERFHQVETRDIKNITEDGELIELFPGLHSQLYSQFRNKTLEPTKTVTGAEQSMYTTNPLNNTGDELLQSTHIKISGNDNFQETDAIYTRNLLPFRTHGKVFDRGNHLIYNYGVQNKNLSGSIDSSNLRPKIHFKYTDPAKNVDFTHPYTGVVSKPKYELILIMKEICGLYFKPNTLTRFIPSRGSVELPTMPSLKRDGEGAADDSVSKKQKTSTEL